MTLDPNAVTVLASSPLCTLALVDGRSAVLAPMSATDGARLLRFHHTLSPETTYVRFFMVHTELSPSEVARFVRVDHHDREAITVTVGDELIGVGRFDRLQDPRHAEVAFLVADEHQGEGIGRALFVALSDRARQVGIETFFADVLPANGRMLRLFHGTGLAQEQQFEGGVMHLALSLGREPGRPGEAQGDRRGQRQAT